VGAVAFKKDLGNTLKLCEALGNPHLRFKSIHVAGTNGKGSTCHMLSSIFQCAGYKTGLYTSPHLKEFTERIRIDGEEVSQAFVVDFVNRILPAIHEIKPSFFEITVAMAFDFFAREKVDIAIVEVGLGGRLDSTNVITPLVSVITNISWDHKDLLGDTLPAIASEKAGIIKKHVSVVVSERQNTVEHVFIAKAKQEASEIVFASDVYSVKQEEEVIDILKDGNLYISDLHFPLHGSYQKQNIPGVMQTIDVVRREFGISDLHIRRGLEEVLIRTGLKGRWQQIHTNPTVVCDTGHNAGGVHEVMSQIARQEFDNLFIVWGMVKDKDTSDILRLLPKHAYYFFCQAKIPRAMDAVELCDRAHQFGLKGEAVPDVNEAKKRALAKSTSKDFILIGGSTYVVAEIEEL
ncbi:MAG TPA: folylpolyglutamate synthase/dihydrofolate synthase family protein, partial [Chryseosolibacter sp.]|nr:folylpolyglutamate synthase/dihydrofolate synthase family protein [Chryseosolibacter sp.]